MEIAMKGGAEEVRKVQLTGKSTYIVSLPKRWVSNMGIKPGDGLIIREQDDSALLISAKGVQKPERLGEVEIEIAPQENSLTIARKIISLYLVGYSTIRLVSAEGRITSEQRETIKDFARKKLIGTEITSDSLSEMTLQILLSYPEISVKDALRRMSLISSAMQKDAITALERFDRALARDTIEMDDEVDRFHMYVIRLLKSAVENPRLIKEIGLESARDCLGYRIVTKSVERVADHAAAIARKVAQLRRRARPELLERISAMSSLVGSIFEDAVKSLFKRDYGLAEEVIKRAAEIELLENEAVQSMSGRYAGDTANLRLIVESLRRVAEYSADIAEIVLNLTITSGIKRISKNFQPP